MTVLLIIRKIVFLKDETADAIRKNYSLYMRTIMTQKTSRTRFLYSILEFSLMQANVAHDESCLCMPCRIVHLRHYESLQLWELWNLFKESFPKATSNALDKAYLATMKCVVVSKTFKTEVAEEQTKFKQIKRQLNALGFDNEYAGQMANTRNNACWVFNHLKRNRVT